jgi:hypothetical protein
MTDENVVKVVDNLYAIQGTSLLTRAANSAPYITSGVTTQAHALRAMVADEERHLQQLADLLNELDATPGPRLVRAADADLHYVKVQTLIPRLIRDKQRLVAEFEHAADEVAPDPRAANIVTQITSDHRRHLEELPTLFSGPVA